MIKPTRVIAKVVLLAPDGETLLMRRSSSDTRRPLEWDLAAIPWLPILKRATFVGCFLPAN